MKLRTDPAVRALIPPLRARDQAYLEGSLKTYGCHDPIRAWRGIVLDGHKRLTICKKLGIPFRVDPVDLPDRASALLWVAENQLNRPDLTPDQRAAVALHVHHQRAAAVESHSHRRGVATGSNGDGRVRPYSMRAVAHEASVSAYKVEEAALIERGDHRLLQAVFEGRKTLLAARLEIVQRKRAASRRATAATVKRLPTHVRAGDFRDNLANIPDDSVDLIFTDPPYDKASVPLYGDLAKLAARVLVPGGSLVCYAGVHSLPELFPLMSPHLRFWWQMCLRLSGAFPRQHGWRVHVHYKPLLWFVKGTYRGEYVVDVIESTWLAKNWHDWEQSEAEAAHCISKMTPEGGFVLDPMCGSGTTLVAAARLGRCFLGVELDREKAKVAAARLRQEAQSSR